MHWSGISTIGITLAEYFQEAGHLLKNTQLVVLLTDGAQFARNGTETVSIIGMPTDVIRKEIFFHTMKDTPDNISLKAVSTIIEVLSKYIGKIDKE